MRPGGQVFRHIVLLRLRDDVEPGTAAGIAEELGQLPGRIPEVRSYQIGLDAGVNEGNADLVVVADFDGVDGYLVYRDHEAHQAVIRDRIAPVLAERSAVQYEY